MKNLTFGCYNYNIISQLNGFNVICLVCDMFRNIEVLGIDFGDELNMNIL